MADKVTTVTTLDVQCMDVNGGLTTYKIDNYRDSVTKIAVINAFANAIDNQLILGNSGALLQRVAKVTKTESIKTVLDNQTVYVTPTSIDTTASIRGAEVSESTITVTDGICQGVNVENFTVVNTTQTMSDETSEFVLYADVSSNGATITVTLGIKTQNAMFMNNNHTATADIKIIIGGLEYNVPYKNVFTTANP